MTLKRDAEGRRIRAHHKYFMGGDPIGERVENRISNLLNLALIAERTHKLHRCVARAGHR